MIANKVKAPLFFGSNDWYFLSETLQLCKYFLFPVLYIALSFSHLASVTEQVADGKSLKSSEEIASMILSFEEARGRASSPENYFVTLHALDEVSLQCSLFMEVMKGVPMLPPHPCFRWREREGNFRTMLLYTNGKQFPMEQMQMIAENHREQFRLFEERKKKQIYTVWHREEFISWYVNGLVVSSFLFLIRLRRHEFNIVLEVLMPRFALALLLWPIAIFVYPGDVRKQFRDALRMGTSILVTALSCFGTGIGVAKAEPKQSSKKGKEETGLSVSGFVQGNWTESDPNTVSVGNVRLRMNWKLANDWLLASDFGFSPFDFESGRQVRQMYVNKHTPIGSFSVGRIFSVAGYTTPSPHQLITVSYPNADPTRGESYGIQYGYTVNQTLSGYLAITGASGKSFYDWESNISSIEEAFRIEWNASDHVLLAMTGQVREDMRWIGPDFRFNNDEFEFHSVLYFGEQIHGDAFFNGFGVITWKPCEYGNIHLMYDHDDIHNADQITIGASVFSDAKRNLSITADMQINTDNLIDTSVMKLRFQVAF